LLGEELEIIVIIIIRSKKVLSSNKQRCFQANVLGMLCW